MNQASAIRMSDSKPLILVCNDDGIHAPGIQALVKAVDPLGEVVIVAPDSPQSGKGHAVTIDMPLKVQPVEYIFPNHVSYQTSGTPVDCVKLAVDKIMHRRPDLLVSGVNHGQNSSINVIYSGTMSAAIEGALEGIPSIGFSLCDYSYHADFSLASKIARRLSAKVLERGLPKGVALNVNIPACEPDTFQGIRICRQANAKWADNFEERTNPYGRKYYWMSGVFKVTDHGEDTDEWALKNNYASIVPVQYDMTAHHALGNLNDWDL